MAKAKPKAKLLSHMKPLAVLVCDEMRQEITGKQIIIGLYTGNIIVEKFPAAVPLTFLMVMQVLKPGHLEMEIEFVGPDQGMSQGVVFDVDFKEPTGPLELAYVPIPRLRFAAKAPGQIEVRIREKDGEWLSVRRIRLENRPTPSDATVQQQPSSQSPA